jgi:sortase A
MDLAGRMAAWWLENTSWSVVSEASRRPLMGYNGLRSRGRSARSRMEGTIERFTETVLNLMSLLLVGVGIAVTASFFVGPQLHDAVAEVPQADKVITANKEPNVPVSSEKVDRAIERQHRETLEEARQRVAHERAAKKPVPRGPKNKMLRMTIPAMAQIRNDTVPYSESDDKDAFHDHAAVHLRGTGSPWDRHPNVYIAGHRLGFPGTNSWLAFWDLNVLHKGDMIYLRDAAGDRYAYRVFRRFIVGPNQVSVTRPLPGRNIVSLQTCTLPDYSERLIVQAEKVSKK